MKNLKDDNIVNSRYDYVTIKIKFDNILSSRKLMRLGILIHK